VDLRWHPEAAVVHPSGAGMVILGDIYDGGKHKVIIYEISPRFEAGSPRVIEAVTEGFPDGASPELAVARDAGILFVLFTVPGGGRRTLVALRSDGPEKPLVERWRAPVPARTMLVHDRSSRRAFALVDHPGGLAIAELGPEPPDLPESGRFYMLPDAFNHVNYCGLEHEFGAWAVCRGLSDLPPDERAAAIARMEDESLKEPKKLLNLLAIMLMGEWRETAERIAARAEVLFPEEPTVLVAPFALLVARHAWDELLPKLYAEAGRFRGPMVQHYYHLLATAHARAGDVDEALRYLATAEALNADYRAGYRCSPSLTALRKALDSLPGGADDLSFDRPICAQLVAVLHAADRLLGEGNPAGAIVVLERPLVWDLFEVHSLSRLTAAWLEIRAQTPAERFRKALALATFVTTVEDDRGGRREGLAPSLAWSEERIGALREAAVAWLVADQGVARAASWGR
jgi:hypothetical protein